jgi:hypothetical protein
MHKQLPMHRFLELRPGLVCFHLEERRTHHADSHPAEQTVDVLISLRGGPLVKPQVNGASRHQVGARASSLPRKNEVSALTRLTKAGLPGRMDSCSKLVRLEAVKRVSAS